MTVFFPVGELSDADWIVEEEVSKVVDPVEVVGRVEFVEMEEGPSGADFISGPLSKCIGKEETVSVEDVRDVEGTVGADEGVEEAVGVDGTGADDFGVDGTNATLGADDFGVEESILGD